MLGVIEGATATADPEAAEAAEPAPMAVLAVPGGDDGDGAGPRRDWRHPSANTVVVLLLLVVGVRIGLSPLHDNSFLTHLATGRLIIERGSVPSVDPYSFTAFGSPWTVQSWGASVVYGGLEDLFGLLGIRLFNAVLITSLVFLLWRLTRPGGTLLARLIPAGVVVCMGTSLWVERPLLFGAVALALVLLAADDGLDPRWLVPVMWIWVNTHGSFPFGVGFLVLVVIGRWLDDRSRPVVELRALAWATTGTLLGAINPVGPKMLAFPLELLRKRDAFDRVAEWEPPHFHRGVELFFAVQLLAVVVLVLARHRRWRAILPVAAFGAMALLSTRNILQASIVLTPILAVAAAGLGTLDGGRRPRLLRPVAAALALLLVLVAASGVVDRNTALGAYPRSATTWMRSQGMLDVDDRVASRDWVGNYLEYRYGPGEVRVFIDDRVDMYPLRVIRSFTTLLDEGRDHQAVLDRYEIDSVLWQRDSELGRWLIRSDRWRVVHRDATWLVAVPR